MQALIFRLRCSLSHTQLQVWEKRNASPSAQPAFREEDRALAPDPAGSTLGNAAPGLQGALHNPGVRQDHLLCLHSAELAFLSASLRGRRLLPGVDRSTSRPLPPSCASPASLGLSCRGHPGPEQQQEGRTPRRQARESLAGEPRPSSNSPAPLPTPQPHCLLSLLRQLDLNTPHT